MHCCRLFASLCGAMTFIFACGGGDQTQGDGDTAATARQPPTVAPTPMDSISADAITPQMVALGDSIFRGQAAGGICFTCHGPEAKGSTLAPDLTDNAWLNGDGNLNFIISTVRHGVAQPKQYPAPMPPFGQTLSTDQINAVSAYVYSLTHPR